MKQYMQHLDTCAIKQGQSGQPASDCNCGMQQALTMYDNMYENMIEGRHYLMGVDPSSLNVEDALEAFGFGRNGLK